MAKPQAGPVQPKLDGRKQIPLSFHLNWKAYYQEFERQHGGTTGPIMYKGKLLFPDGWRYSSTDHAGPEYPPPADPNELVRLQRTYWKILRAITLRELRVLGEQIKSLEDAQQSRSVPLQYAVMVFDEEQQKFRTEYQPATKEIFRGRIEWLNRDLEESEENLRRIDHHLDLSCPERTDSSLVGSDLE